MSTSFILIEIESIEVAMQVQSYDQFITPLIFYLCLSFASCSFTPNELKVAEQVMEEHPDSALNILQKLSKETYSSDANLVFLTAITQLKKYQ